MRDKIRGRAECTSAHGSYYNFLGKKVEKPKEMYCFVLTFDFWFFGRGARCSYCSILQRAFWQHFSQNQFWSRHFFLQLTHHTVWLWHSQKAKSMEKYLSPEGKPKPISRSVRSVFLSATTQCNFVTKMWPLCYDSKMNG